VVLGLSRVERSARSFYEEGEAMVASLKVVSDRNSQSMDKQKALDAALAQIDRAFGKGSAMKLGSREAMQIEAISTGSLGLDIALGIGGLPRGRIVEIYGPESSGKTTLALHAIAEAQKNGGAAPLSMPSMRSIRFTPRSSASTSTS
jgi:recombination protein RecA